MIVLIVFAAYAAINSVAALTPPTGNLCVTGRQQAPINVQPDKAVVVDNIDIVLNHLNDATAGGDLTNYGYGWLNAWYNENNDYEKYPTLEIQSSSDLSALKIQSYETGTYYYRASALYFNPTLHSINGKFYDLELQIIFKYYSNNETRDFDEDRSSPSGGGGGSPQGRPRPPSSGGSQSGTTTTQPAVQIRIVVLFEAGPQCNPFIEPISSMAGRIDENNNSTSSQANLSQCRLIPTDTKFVLYRGSQLSNDCPQNTIYAVALTPNYMSDKQLAQFANWVNSDGDTGKSDQPQQSPLYGRSLYSGRTQSITCPL